MITVSLRIENAYEDGTEVVTQVEATIPPPPSDPAELESWEHDHIYQHTGTGREQGDAWYDVEITASSDPALVGRTFQFGY